MHAFSARTYIKNVCDKIEKLFETTLRNYESPLKRGYHPELDRTVLLVGDEISKYQILVGSANWTVTLGRFDVYYAVSTLRRYSAMPRQGHMKAMLRVFGYLKHHMKRQILCNTKEPDLNKVEVVRQNWSKLYPDAREKYPGYADMARRRAGQMPPGCDCARVVMGKIYPNECRLYGKACTPRSPVGPCMVSDEGACRIWWAGGVRESAA